MLVSDNSAAIMKIVGKRPAKMNRDDWRAALDVYTPDTQLRPQDGKRHSGVDLPGHPRDLS